MYYSLLSWMSHSLGRKEGRKDSASSLVMMYVATGLTVLYMSPDTNTEKTVSVT